MKARIRIISSLLLLLFWMYFIYGMSAKTGDESAGLSYGLVSFLYKLPFIRAIIKFDTFHTVIRKAAHFTEYGILGLLMLHFLSACGREINHRLYVLTLGFCCIYAALDEYHQSFVAGRGPSVFDVGIDTAGAVFFIILLALYKRVIIHSN